VEYVEDMICVYDCFWCAGSDYRGLNEEFISVTGTFVEK
jgi:hypothetical protein